MTTGFAKVSIKGEGDLVGLALLFARTLTSGLRIKSAMTGSAAPRPVDTALKPVWRSGLPHRLDSRLRGNDGERGWE